MCPRRQHHSAALWSPAWLHNFQDGAFLACTLDAPLMKAAVCRELLEGIMDDDDELKEFNLSSRVQREERRKLRERGRLERELEREREERSSFGSRPTGAKDSVDVASSSLDLDTGTDSTSRGEQGGFAAWDEDVTNAAAATEDVASPAVPEEGTTASTSGRAAEEGASQQEGDASSRHRAAVPSSPDDDPLTAWHAPAAHCMPLPLLRESHLSVLRSQCQALHSSGARSQSQGGCRYNEEVDLEKESSRLPRPRRGSVEYSSSMLNRCPASLCWHHVFSAA